MAVLQDLAGTTTVEFASRLGFKPENYEFAWLRSTPYITKASLRDYSGMPKVGW